MFTMKEETFDQLLQHNNIRWFDIVLYNYIADKSEVVGVYNDDYSEYDKETKTISHYCDEFGLIMTDLQLSRVMRVKGNEDTTKKEISRSLKRLEEAEAIVRIYIRQNERNAKKIRMIVPLLEEV